MTREFLKNAIPELSDDVLDSIMTEHGKAVERERQKLTTAETERDSLKQQLTDANAEIQSYKEMDIDGIKSKAAEWETKYQTDTQALQDQLAAQAYSFAAESAASNLKFSSKAAKTAFVSDLKGTGLKLDDGKLLGLDDYVKKYKESDPDAFVDDGAEPPPRIVSSTSGGGGNTRNDSLRAAFGLKPKE